MPFCIPPDLPDDPLEEPLLWLLLGRADDCPVPEDVPREVLPDADFTDVLLLAELDELADALAEAEAASSASARSCSPDARSALAWITAASSAVVSMVASTWPAVTESPTDTFTEVTVPELGNETLAWLTLSIVPLAESVWVTEPLVAVPVV